MTFSERSFKKICSSSIFPNSLKSPRSNAGASRRSQGFQLARILGLSLLHEPQPFAQHFAGILVAAGLDEGLE
ncbi:hypothetical protein XH94_34025 [Bradyrhizobium zhanjiangense]|uniref:Uncharacterized protein n=1 Tax=Bradyrhizobium zhanjiangense TaxID=1325107 RepID=A0A4V1L2I0_9BRAD|nr:hypothetical protein XH94_34025 [Bradyrhizobium zhanjiangense]